MPNRTALRRAASDGAVDSERRYRVGDGRFRVDSATTKTRQCRTPVIPASSAVNVRAVRHRGLHDRPRAREAPRRLAPMSVLHIRRGAETNGNAARLRAALLEVGSAAVIGTGLITHRGNRG